MQVTQRGPQLTCNYENHSGLSPTHTKDLPCYQKNWGLNASGTAPQVHIIKELMFSHSDESCKSEISQYSSRCGVTCNP